jgi:PAS domain S-box-containing protein
MPDPISLDASAQLDLLSRHGIVDAPSERDFEDLTALASQLCGTSIAAISFVDDKRHWFKSRIGLDAAETPRHVAFCAHAVLRPEEIMVVEDAQTDERFAHNPLVTSNPYVRFYAGAPLVTCDGHALGTICVMDWNPRRLDDEQAEVLRTLARLTASRLGLHRRGEVWSTLLGAAIESTSEAIIISDARRPDLPIVFVNSAFERITGYSAAEAIGRNPRFLQGCDTAPDAVAAFRAALSGGKDCMVEVRNYRKDGTTFWNEVKISPVRDGEGRPTHFIGVQTDITERMLQQNAGRELAAQHRAMLATITEGFWLVDDQGRLLDVNEAYCRMSGYTRDELLKCTISDLEAAESQEETREHMGRVMSAGADRFTSKHRAKDGRVFDVEISASYSKARRCFFVFVHDNSSQVRMEHTLRLQAAALRAAADAIVITDTNGAIEWVNPAFEAFTGFTAAEAIGKNPGALVKSGKHDQAFYKDLWDTIRAGRVWHGEVINRRKDGSLYTERQSITPVLYESGVITHFVAIKEDITEHMQLQAQLLQAQKMESVGRLASGVAHDFNNLLSVILGWTGMALEELPADHAVRPSLEEVLKAGEGAASLTRQLLAFSRQQVVEPTLFNANDLVVEMNKMFRRVIGEDITLVTRTDPELGTVKMDRGQLEQVLMNLLVNARDAMPDGGTLTIETANVVLDAEYARRNSGMTPGEYVMLAVSDSGVGMNEETRTRIFEPFFTTKGHGKGTGLGLATCYGVAKQAGGYIAAGSEEGLGTTMKLYLPRRPEAAVTAARSRKKTPMRGGETILLVEDDAAVRRVTARMLEAQGYRVLSTASGEEALRVIEEEREPLQLVLTDVVLSGGINGRLLADRARTLRPELKVLFASGYTSDVTILHGLLEERVALVQKPFTAELLGRKVREVLDGR